MNKRLQIAIEAAKKAGEIQLEYFGTNLKRSHKSPTDFATEVDFKCEEIIIDHIKTQFPDDGFLAEEGGESNGKNEYVWVIDPLDGTVNYAHGLDYFCVIIGLYNKNTEKKELGVINIPRFNEVYTAVRGEGAYLNGQKITVNNTNRMKDGFLTLGSYYVTYDLQPDHFEKKFISQIEINNKQRKAFLRVRILGSAGVDIAHIAKGVTEAHLCFGTKPWDNIGSSIILEEAGGKIVDNNGDSITLKSRGMIASNSNIFDEFTSLIKRDK